jgi:hypothetical protein
MENLETVIGKPLYLEKDLLTKMLFCIDDIYKSERIERDNFKEREAKTKF